jgi:hypothetical protein
MVRTRTRSIVVLAVGALVLTVAGCGDDDAGGAAPTTAAAATQDVSLLGTWTGHRERIASSEGYRNGTATMTVTEQEGMTFKATMAWSTPDGDEGDPLVGSFAPGGALMAGADDEGTYTFHLVDATTLDYCYAEHGDGYRTTCARLKKDG